MQTKPKHRKKQPRGCPMQGSPRACGDRGRLAGGAVCCTEKPAGKGWKAQTSRGKNRANAGPGDPGMGGCRGWRRPGPSPAAALRPGAAAAPPVLTSAFRLLLWVFFRGYPGSCVLPARRQGVFLYRIIQPFCPGCWPPSRSLSPPLSPSCRLLGAAGGQEPRELRGTCPCPHRHGGTELLLGAPHGVMGEQNNPLHPIPRGEGASDPAGAPTKSTGEEGVVWGLVDGTEHI